MQRITKICLQNFRAFGDEEPAVIALEKGENLLVYGENGSGKTSLYSALLSFLESAATPTARFVANLYVQKDANGVDITPGYVRVSFAYAPVLANALTTTYQFGPAPLATDVAATDGVGFLLKANQSRGFLSYREIVRTYLSTDVRDENLLRDNNTQLQKKRTKRAESLFQLLVETLLAHHQLKIAQRTVREELAELYDFINRKTNSRMFKEANARLANPFDGNSAENDFVDLIKGIEGEVNRYLRDYFANSLQLEFTVFVRRKSSENWNRDLQTELQVKVYLGGQLFVEDYTDFLNEARLSALAVCFYLAAVRAQVEPNIQPEDFKFLFLDDIFIGLDTNNRLPLLNLLHKEFAKHHYQIFLTTYDREWFNLAANWFAKKPSDHAWKQLEMYEGELDPSENNAGSGPFRPVLVSTEGDFEKAAKYFKASEYPAAGNYLRKALEKVTDKLAPYKSGDYDGDATHKGNSVDARFKRLKELRAACEVPLPADLVDDILLYQQLVSHPSSHYNTTHTLYRAELETMFNLVKKLRAEKVYRRIRLLAAGEILRYEASDLATYGNYWSECQLVEDLWVVLAEGQAPKLLDCKTRTLRWEWNGIANAKNKDGAMYSPEEVEKHCSKVGPLTSQPKTIAYALRISASDVDVLRDFKVVGLSVSEVLDKRQTGFPTTAQEAL